VQGVVIVPVGLVYEAVTLSPDTTLQFGRPIAMDDWLETATTGAFGTVGAVTNSSATNWRANGHFPRHVRNAAARSRRPATRHPRAGGLGMLANAPVLVAGLLARGVVDEMWQASIKGLSATVLLPLAWGTELALLSRRCGARRASVLTAAGAAGGLATLAWLDRRRGLAVGAYGLEP
jgi:hypothetical protein